MELRVLCLISYHSAFTDQPGLWVIRDKTWIVPHLSCAAGRSQTWRLAFGICGVVVQLVRTPACQAGGRRFEPGRPRHCLSFVPILGLDRKAWPIGLTCASGCAHRWPLVDTKFTNRSGFVPWPGRPCHEAIVTRASRA